MPHAPQTADPQTAAAVLRFRQRLWRLLMRNGACAAVSAALWLSAAALLVSRLAGLHGSLSLRLGVVAGAMIVAVATGAAWAGRRLPSDAACRALLDAASAAGGLIMSAGVTGHDAWPSAAPRPPQLAWQWRRHAVNIAAATLFTLAITLLPSRSFNPLPPAAPRTLEPLIGALNQRMAEAAAAELLPEPLLAAYSNQLAQAAQSGDAADPARTLEALDHIDQELTREAAAQTAEAALEQEAVNAALALAEHLAANSDSFTADTPLAADAAAALSQFLQHSALPPALASNLLALTATDLPALDAATLAQLAALLREASLSSDIRLERLVQLSQANPGRCSGGACTNAAAANAALARLLAEDGDGAECAAALLAMCGAPGAGAPTRGPGAAPLTWTDPSSREGVAFLDDSLTSPTLPNIDQARLTALSSAAPEVAATPHATRPGALADAPRPAIGNTPQTTILPRHRAAITHFFE